MGDTYGHPGPNHSVSIRSNFRSPIIGVSEACFDPYDPEWSVMTSVAGSSRVKPFSPDTNYGWLIIFPG